jgi:methylated-DNA-[protein]-cysteine S-methyltransferase
MTFFSTLLTPIGRLRLVARGDALSGIYMEDHAGAPLDDAGWIEDGAPSSDPRSGAASVGASEARGRFRHARAQLTEYFGGARTSFDLPMAAVGTPFQRRVWSALLAIPFAATITYGELARRVGSPGAARAVGRANATNPLSIVVPCHRVIGADGALTGYAGGEARKRWLLEHERAVMARGARRVVTAGAALP